MGRARFVALLILAAGLVLLVGCSATERLDGTAEAAASDLDSYSLGIDTGSAASTLSTTPSHVTCELQGILSVDADVKVPASRDQISGFTAQRIAWTPDQVAPLFFHGALPEAEETTYANNPWYVCDSDEGNLSFGTGSLMFNSSAFRAQAYEIALLSCSSPAAMQEAFAGERLASLDPDKAAGQVRDLVETLGVEPYGEPSVYALSSAKLNELAEQNRSGTSLEDLFTLTEEDYSHVYTVDDEVCIVRWDIGYGDIPVTASSYSDGKSDRYYLGSSIEAWVTKAGIVRIAVSEGINGFAPSEASDAIVPLDRALVLAAQKYSEVISNSALTIREIRFEYVPRPRDDSFDSVYYTPAWYLSPGVEEEQYATSIRVDAITGEVF